MTLDLFCMNIFPVLGYPASDAGVYEYFANIEYKDQAFLKGHTSLASRFFRDKAVGVHGWPIKGKGCSLREIPRAYDEHADSAMTVAKTICRFSSKCFFR